MEKKEKCNCGNVALWMYAPGYSDNSNSYHCDDCVPRGCSCNWNYTKTKESKLEDGALIPEGIENIDWRYVDCIKAKQDGFDNIKPKEYFVYLDEKQREHPCVEFWYDKDGFEQD